VSRDTDITVALDRGLACHSPILAFLICESRRGLIVMLYK
jgi:hypothetical protein